MVVSAAGFAGVESIRWQSTTSFPVMFSSICQVSKSSSQLSAVLCRFCPVTRNLKGAFALGRDIYKGNAPFKFHFAHAFAASGVAHKSGTIRDMREGANGATPFPAISSLDSGTDGTMSANGRAVTGSPMGVWVNKKTRFVFFAQTALSRPMACAISASRNARSNPSQRASGWLATLDSPSVRQT